MVMSALIIILFLKVIIPERRLSMIKKIIKVTLMSFYIILFIFSVALIVIMLSIDQYGNRSPYDYYISGKSEIESKIGENFDNIFKDNFNISEIISSCSNISYLIEREAKLISCRFAVNRNGANVAYSDIILDYFIPNDPEYNVPGRIIVNIFLPNTDINYSVNAEYAKGNNKEDLQGFVESSVVEGSYLSLNITDGLILENIKEDYGVYEVEINNSNIIQVQKKVG